MLALPLPSPLRLATWALGPVGFAAPWSLWTCPGSLGGDSGKRFRRHNFVRREAFVEECGKNQDDPGQLPQRHCVRISYVGPSVN